MVQDRDILATEH